MARRTLRPLHRVYRVERWLQRRFTAVGRLLLAALVAVGLFAINPRATLAYQLAVMIAAVLVASSFWAPFFRPRVTVRRRLPRFATVGRAVDYPVRVANEGRAALQGAAVEEAVSASMPTLDDLRDVEAGRGPDARRVPGGGYLRFVAAARLAEGLRASASTLPTLAPGEAVTVTLSIVPYRRGYLDLRAARLTRPDPLGVVRAQYERPVADRLLVIPARHPVRWRAPGHGALRESRGRSRSERIGGGADFARLREYRPRDPLRHIHWRAWARLGEPVVKEFHDPSPSRNALILDTFPPAGASAAEFEDSVEVAASFAADAGWRSGRLDLLFVGRTLVRVAEGYQAEGTGRMLEALACVRPATDGAFGELADTVRKVQDRFGCCVCVFQQWSSERLALATAMHGAGIVVLVLVVGSDAASAVAELGTGPLAPGHVCSVPPGRAREALASLGSGSNRGGEVAYA